jgi:hypothetical protein
MYASEVAYAPSRPTAANLDALINSKQSFFQITAQLAISYRVVAILHVSVHRSLYEIWYRCRCGLQNTSTTLLASTPPLKQASRYLTNLAKQRCMYLELRETAEGRF